MSQLWGAFWCRQILWLLSKKDPGGLLLLILIISLFKTNLETKMTSASMSLVRD